MINLKQLLSENMVRFGTKNLSEHQLALLNEASGPYSPPQMNDTNAPNRLKFKSIEAYEAWRAPISLSIPNTKEAFDACGGYVFDAAAAKDGKFVKTYTYSTDSSQTCDKYLTHIYHDVIEACAVAGQRGIGFNPATLPQIFSKNVTAFETRDSYRLFTDLRQNVGAGTYYTGPGNNKVYSILFRPAIFKYIALKVLTPALQNRCALHCVQAGNKPKP